MKTTTKQNPDWFREPLKKAGGSGCLCCPANTLKLSMKDKVTGDHFITKNGELIDIYEGNWLLVEEGLGYA